MTRKGHMNLSLEFNWSLGKFKLTRDDGDVRLPKMANRGLSSQSALRSVKHAGRASGKTTLSIVLTTAGVTRHIPVT